MSDPHKRRWYQFSLKTLLSFVLVASVSTGWVGAGILRAREDRERKRQKCRENMRNLDLALGSGWPTEGATKDDKEPQQDSPQCEILP